MRKEGSDSKYEHLKEELHVEITSFAQASDAYSRISNALNQIKRFLVPVSSKKFFLFLFPSFSLFLPQYIFSLLSLSKNVMRQKFNESRSSKDWI